MSPISAFPALNAQAFRPMPLPKALPQSISPQPLPLPLPDLRELPAPLKIGGAETTPRLDQVRTGTGSFDSTLGRLVGDVNQKQTQAAATVRGLLNGEDVQLHQAVIAMEEASVSFQLMVEVRNKLLESYQELMRMQI